jgi:hypothetical protein
VNTPHKGDDDDDDDDNNNNKKKKKKKKVHEKHTEKARSQGTVENGHIGHCTRNSESTNIEVRNVQHGK